MSDQYIWVRCPRGCGEPWEQYAPFKGFCSYCGAPAVWMPRPKPENEKAPKGP